LAAAYLGAFSDKGLDSQSAEAVRREHPELTLTKVGDFGWFGCGQWELLRTKFTAVDENNIMVPGVVCTNPVSGSTTVRLTLENN